MNKQTADAPFAPRHVPFETFLVSWVGLAGEGFGVRGGGGTGSEGAHPSLVWEVLPRFLPVGPGQCQRPGRGSRSGRVG